MTGTALILLTMKSLGAQHPSSFAGGVSTGVFSPSPGAILHVFFIGVHSGARTTKPTAASRLTMRPNPDKDVYYT